MILRHGFYSVGDSIRIFDSLYGLLRFQIASENGCRLDPVFVDEGREAKELCRVVQDEGEMVVAEEAMRKLINGGQMFIWRRRC